MAVSLELVLLSSGSHNVSMALILMIFLSLGQHVALET